MSIKILDAKGLREQFYKELAVAQSPSELEILRIRYLGRKQGSVTMLLRSLKDFDDREKRIIAPALQALRAEVEEAIKKKSHTPKQTTALSGARPIDVTVPGIVPVAGHRHPISIVRDELLQLFRSMGFAVFEGPEMEHDFYNFEALNFPPQHPARDIQDTFFVATALRRASPHGRKLDPKKWLMRTHTSNMQVRLMEQHTPPLRAVVAGRCFRNEATDARHEHTFYQLEGFVVDRDVSVRQLSWTLHEIFRQLFGSDAKVRLRPGYFPFVEPGYEVDMSCAFCNQKGCNVCKQTGWLEMAGAGMIHPNVFAAAGYPKGKYTGFALGLGFVRIAMLRYNIPDIRMFLESDIRFLENF